MSSLKCGLQSLALAASTVDGPTVSADFKSILNSCVNLCQDTVRALYHSISIDRQWSPEDVWELMDSLEKDPWKASAVRRVSVDCTPKDANGRVVAINLGALLVADDFVHPPKITTLELTQDMLIHILQYYDWPYGEPRYKDYFPNGGQHSPRAWEDALASKKFGTLQALDALTVHCPTQFEHSPHFADYTFAGFCRAYSSTLIRLRLVDASHSYPRLLSSLADNLVVLEISISPRYNRRDMPWHTETSSLHSWIMFPRLEKLELHEAARKRDVRKILRLGVL